MSNLSIVRVSGRRQRKQFLELPWTLYRSDPNWTPPLRTNQKELVGYKPHPFYDKGQVQTFLALRDGQPCGRVAAIINPAHNERHQEQRGFFGFFESIDDQSVACGLLDAAREWFREKEMSCMRGPCNPSLNYECGLLVEGFDTPPTFMMTYNPPYYAKLIEGCGFEKSQDLYAYWGEMKDLGKLDEKFYTISKMAAERFNVTTRGIDTSRFVSEVKMFLDIYNRSLVGTWGFAPMSDAEVEHSAHSLRRLIVPELTAVAEVEGKPVGVCFGLLDYNPRIKLIDGRLFPFGFLKLLNGKRKIKAARILSTNVLPEYQSWGIGLVVMAKLLPDAIDWGIETGEFSWVLESNHLSRKSLERAGVARSKTYRLYDAQV